MDKILESITFLMLLGILFCMFLTLRLVKETTELAISINEISTRPAPPTPTPEPELNKCNLLAELYAQGVHYPEVVYAQSMIESAHLTSNVCVTKNNLFGMHQPTVRKSTTIANKGDKYAKFATWQDAVEDMKLWQEMHELNGQEFTNTQYICFLRTSGYIAGADKEYETLLTKIDLPKCND